MNKLTLWNKFGRFVTGAVVLCFFLPFFGVSCQGIDVVTVSGADMVYGGKPGGMINDMADEMGARGMEGGKQETIGNVDREPLAIAAVTVALVLFGLAWARTRGALIACAVLAIAGIGLLGGLYVKINGDMDKAVKAEIAKKEGGDEEVGSRASREIAAAVDSGARIGFWLTALGFAAVAGLAIMALRERQVAVPAYPPPPPPSPA